MCLTADMWLFLTHQASNGSCRGTSKASQFKSIRALLASEKALDWWWLSPGFCFPLKLRRPSQAPGCFTYACINWPQTEFPIASFLGFINSLQWLSETQGNNAYWFIIKDQSKDTDEEILRHQSVTFTPLQMYYLSGTLLYRATQRFSELRSLSKFLGKLHSIDMAH